MDFNYIKTLPSAIETIKSNYEAFILENYKLDHIGLFHDENNLYAVVNNLTASGLSLQEVNKLYDHNFRTIGVPGPLFVEKQEESFIRVPLRNTFERVNLFGQFFNVSDFNNKMNMSLPLERHPFKVKISWVDNTLKFTFKKKVTESEFQDIVLICEGLGFYGYNYENNTDEDLPDYDFNIEKARKSPGNLTLISSSYQRNVLPTLVSEKYQEDQDFWSQNKFSVFSDVSMSREDCLTESFRNTVNSCFVDATVFQRNNIREYLSLYDTVIIAAPLADSSMCHEFYETFRLNRTELLELVKRGRVKFVTYQNLHRYDLAFIADVLNADPDCVLFSRRLASASLIEIRKKTGLFGFSFDTDMQYRIQKSCWESGNLALKILAETLSHNGSFLEHSLDFRGAMGLSHFGAGIFADNIYKQQGKDFSIELISSAMSFEFAQGLNAHHFPFDNPGYSELNACRIIHGIYNGVQASTHKIRESEVKTLLSEVLTISNDMGVLELDDIMSEHGRKKIPEILSKYSGLSKDELAFEIYNLNKEIKRIEKREDRISGMDIAGLVPTAAGAYMEYRGIPGGAYVALLPWVIKSLNMPLRFLDSYESEIINRLSQLTRGGSSNTLLIQRIRKDIS